MDLSKKYNTALTPYNEVLYQQWINTLSKQQNRDVSRDLYDYDLRGAFLDGAGQSSNGHFPDKFKKPNHPTFSRESKYNGADGYQGGEWIKTPAGKWVYNASQTNIDMIGKDNLNKYFNSIEAGNMLNLPSKGLLSK